jgi:hypothetical protein
MYDNRDDGTEGPMDLIERESPFLVKMRIMHQMFFIFYLGFSS